MSKIEKISLEPQKSPSSYLYKAKPLIMLRRYFLLLTLFSLPLFMHAQKGFWGAGVRANLLYGSIWDYTTDLGAQAPYPNNAYRGATAWGLGASATYHLGSQWFLDVGLHYQQRRHEIRFSRDWAYIDPYYGFLSTGNIEYVKSRLNHYFEIPLRLNYFFDPSNQGWYSQVGLTSAFLVVVQDYYPEFDETTRAVILSHRSSLYELPLFVQVGCGYRYALSHRLFLDLGVFAQHQIIPKNILDQYREFNWGLGLELVVQYRIR